MPIVGKKRIILNIVATYGRSLFGILCSLITAGWVFTALGEVNFGLYGVVGGLTSFVGFINSVLAGAVGRFYAYSVGESHDNLEVGLENCRKWFNTAVTIHSVIPVVLVIIGYPLGAYAVRHWLTIPVDRIEDCIWIWRFSCLSCFISMVSIPFNAMYTAKQYIAELTIYSFLTTILNLLFVMYMHFHPKDWLVPYAAMICAIGLIPQIIIPIRAYFIFPECKFIKSYLFSKEHIRQIFIFSGYQGMGSLSALLRSQGFSVLTNIYFGPSTNAAMSIGSSVVGHTSSLSTSIMGAFAPAITNSCGAKDFNTMRKIAYQLNKYGTLMTLLFALPIMLELPKILDIWLQNPPNYTVGLTLIAFGIAFINSISVGEMTAINASGKIKGYHIFLSSVSMFTLPMAWWSIKLGGGVYTMQGILLFMTGLNTLGRIYFARLLVEMSSFFWVKHIFLPLVAVIIATVVLGWLPHLFMSPSIVRTLVTFVITEMIFIPISWFIVLDNTERNYLLKLLKKIKIFNRNENTVS